MVQNYLHKQLVVNTKTLLVTGIFEMDPNHAFLFAYVCLALPHTQHYVGTYVIIMCGIYYWN